MSTVVSLLSGAAVGAVLAVVIRARFEREHEWRKSLVEAAAEYASKLAGASTAVAFALRLVEKPEVVDAPPSDDMRNCGDANGEVEKAVNDAGYLTNELTVPLARVELLFFRHPPVQEAADQAFERLQAAANALRRSGDPTEARVEFERAVAQRERFRNAVSQTLRKSIWRAA